MNNKQYNTLSEEALIKTVIGEIKRLINITITRIKNVYSYFNNVFISILTYQLKIRMKMKLE